MYEHLVANIFTNVTNLVTSKIFSIQADNGPDYYSCPITHTTLSVHEDLINVKGKRLKKYTTSMIIN